MPDSGNARPRRRARKNRSVLYAPLSFILICAVMVFGMSVFFRVSVIEVTGSDSYTSEEIIAASGLEVGDNLFFMNRSTAISSIYSRLPYIEHAYIDRKLPNKIIINVTESSAVAYVALGNELWIIDRSCKLLGVGKLADVEGCVSVLGVTPSVPVVGETLRGDASDAPKVEYIAAVLRELTERGMTADITWLDVSNVGSPSFDYLGRFIVKLGTNENLRYKFDLLGRAVEQLGAGDAGTIDLSGEGKAQFLPE